MTNTPPLLSKEHLTNCLNSFSYRVHDAMVSYSKDFSVHTWVLRKQLTTWPQTYPLNVDDDDDDDDDNTPLFIMPFYSEAVLHLLLDLLGSGNLFINTKGHLFKTKVERKGMSLLFACTQTSLLFTTVDSLIHLTVCC